MAEVACFCGCFYSFDGDGGACPQCGEYASVRTAPALRSSGRSQPGQPAPAANSAGRNGQKAGTGRERVEVSPGSLAGIATDMIARDRRTGQERRR